LYAEKVKFVKIMRKVFKMSRLLKNMRVNGNRNVRIILC